MLAALGLATAASASTVASVESVDFAAYQAKYGKVYAPTEMATRQALFAAAKAEVVAHNREYEAGVHTWWKDLTEFADYTEEEFSTLRSTYTSHHGSSEAAVSASARPKSANPDSVDWRTKGAVTAVKNQGGCGSCWSFSATETIESHYFIASGKLVELAPQTFVNCVENPQSCGGTGGCEGATMELAFNLTAKTGIALESDLPYKGSDEKCTDYKAAVKASGYVKNPENDAAGLETALATTGPQSITVAAGSWQLYGGGVFTGCSKGGLFHTKVDATLDHGVQAVGYSADYWIVRNSWGAGWGEKGFIRISRAADNQTFVDDAPADGVACKPLPKSQTVGGECGILFDTSYPTGVVAA